MNRRWLLLVGIGLVAAYLVYFAYLPSLDTVIDYQDVSVEAAKTMIDATTSPVILDVRTVQEYAVGHIEGAVNIPVEELEQRFTELDAFRATLVYCRSGVRSAQAAQILVDKSFTQVYNMLGGLLAWEALGYPQTM